MCSVNIEEQQKKKYFVIISGENLEGMLKIAYFALCFANTLE